MFVISFFSIVRPDTETLQQTISQVPHARTISDNDESDAVPASVDLPLSKSRDFGRKKSGHSDNVDTITLHKAKSQGNLINSRNINTLPAPANRTQMHRLLKSKKSLTRAKSIPDWESSTAADRLLEMSFEEMAKGNFNKPRRHTFAEDSTVDTENGTDPNAEKVLSMKSQNVATSNVLNKYNKVDSTLQTEYSDGICLDCLRSGNKCVDCIHKKPRPVSVGEVHIEEGDVKDSRLYNRQYSDILLIPGPFDYHDQIAAIEDTNSI